MHGLFAWIRSLGNAGAIANAWALAEQQHEDDDALKLLRRHVAATPAAPAGRPVRAA